jgi:DNA replication and repair protein RecF
VHVTSLSLTDFRSYREADVALGPGPTAFVGRNGQGKTNLVEALGYLSTQSSHRVASDAALVRHGAQSAVLRATLVRDGRTTTLELMVTPGRANRARVNGSPLPRQRDLTGNLRTVLFAPEDLVLVKGDPQDRRRFLDDLLAIRAPRFAGVRADYERVVRQRNALLKSMGGRRGGLDSDASHTLEVWDAQLVRLGAELLAGRIHLTNILEPLLQKAYDDVSDAAGPASARYLSSLGDGFEPTTDRSLLESALLSGLEQRRRQELDRGVTLVGPHRDDLVLTLGGFPAKGYASHGESWSMALALRLASYELLRADGTPGGEPVLMLDDVFAELDVDRRARLAALVGEAEQVLVTAAVDADVPAQLRGTRIVVQQGTLRPGPAAGPGRAGP